METPHLVAVEGDVIDHPTGLPEVRVRTDGGALAWREPDRDRWTVQGIGGTRLFSAFARDEQVAAPEWMPMTAGVDWLAGGHPAPLTAELLRSFAKDAIIDRLGYWRASTIRELRELADDVGGGFEIVLNSGGNLLAVSAALTMAGVRHETTGDYTRPAVVIPAGQAIRW